MEEEIRLIEPQKFVLFRSTKMRGIIFTILLLSDNLVELVFPRWTWERGTWCLPLECWHCFMQLILFSDSRVVSA